jgi:hypothetical protein
MRRFTVILVLSYVFLFGFLIGCQTIPKDALRLSPESLKERQLQTRKYETTDESKILAACAALLQDMGFNLDESETELGVLVASKMRSAVSAGQQVAAVIVGLLGGGNMPTDKEQQMRASVVTRPVGENHIAVRVTFQRIVWNTQGQVSVREGLTDPEIYQEFFGKLSKSIFLEAHAI